MIYKKSLLAAAIAMAMSAQISAQESPDPAEETTSGEEQADDIVLEEVLVFGVRGAEQNAREAERAKDVFSSIIGQDDSGNFADQNVAESLRRLPGITLQRSEGEGKFINLRGLGPGFVSVQMNGAEMANGGSGSGNDSEGRGFSLDALPADVLASIEVVKSLTADMDLNSIGGSVNVKTASALDSGEDSLKLVVQDYYHNNSGQHSPKFTLRGNKIFTDDVFGLNYSMSYENRKTEGYESRHHDTTLPRYVIANSDEGSSPLLIPWELQNRMEVAERERLAAILSFDFRPDDDNSYYFRFSNTNYTDDDTALREYYRFGGGAYDKPVFNSNTQSVDRTPTDGDEIYYADGASKVFGVTDIDLQHQFFFQEAESDTKVYSIGGENLFDGGWSLDYDYTFSESTLESPDGRRVQFRSRDLAAIGQFGEDFINGQIVHPDQLEALAGVDSLDSVGGFGPSGYQVGQTVQPFMLYDNLFLEQSFREDSVDQFTLNLEKEMDSGSINFIKAGVKIKNRERQRDKDRQSIIPNDKAVAGCGGNLDCVTAAGSRLENFSTFIPGHPNFDHAFISESDAEGLLALTRAIGENYDPTSSEVESTRHDYALTEDAAAAYVMADFQIGESSNLNVGVRYVQTDFSSTGFMSIRNDREESSDQLESFDIALPIEDTAHSYSGFYPSVHFRSDLSDQLLFRASLWTSFSRPSFDQARPYFQVRDRVHFCNFDPAANLAPEDSCGEDRPENLRGDVDQTVFDSDAYRAEFIEFDQGGNTVNLGNPTIDPMNSTNLDISLGYYGDGGLHLQAAFFYKDIQDFIVEARGLKVDIAQLPYDLPVDQIDLFNFPSDAVIDGVNTFTNGESAQVMGLELTYNQNFNEDHGFLNNFFIHSNMTLLSSEADYGDSVYYQKFRAPEQADLTFNASIGWENESFSARFTANHQSEILKLIGVCSVADYEADFGANISDADSATPYPDSCASYANVWQGESTSFDIKLTYEFADRYKVYFDAVNITDDAQLQYMEGDSYSGGHMLYKIEDFGRGYQLGFQVDLM